MSQSMMALANPVSSSLLTQSLGTGTSKLKAADTSGTATTGSSTSTSSTDSIGSTFLSLLVQELQNQDPTAPMDSTQMVGQMISLNQLNQLTSINQTLSNAYSSTSTGSTTGASAARGSASSASGQAVTSAATSAALRLLSHSGVTTQPAVSTSVTLPAL